MSKGKDEHQYAIIQRSSFINPHKPDYRDESRVQGQTEYMTKECTIE